MILLIDNYDSFTYNLAHALEALGAEVMVVRNDRIDADRAVAVGPTHLVISPGPGRPSEAGCTLDVVRRLAGRVPTSALGRPASWIAQCVTRGFRLAAGG